jgi:signal transduction histidine kinase
LTVTALAGYTPPFSRASSGNPGIDIALTSTGTLVQLVGAALTFLAAVLCRRLVRANRSIGDIYLVFGLVLASLAQVHEAVFPSVHPVDVAVGDLLWLGFGLALLMGIEAEATRTLRDLSAANARLEELRDVEVERAALEERTRLSREIHDGLAQHLWLAKLRLARLSASNALDDESRALAVEATDAIDRGLVDARQAVSTLRMGREAAPLPTLLRGAVDEFSDRYGVPAELDCPELDDRLPARVAVEVLRIVQEALTNVGRHADATLARVEVEAGQLAVTVRVRDNGRGFDPQAVPTGEYGMSSMVERARLIGGDIAVSSRPLDGTVLTLSLPRFGANGHG